MAHVFISYKREDSDFAHALIRQIENAGFKSWIDSEQLRTGEDWWQAIENAIWNSFALILIMTPEAKKSEFVTYEWICARGARVKVIPVLLKPTELHPRMETLQHLDFTNQLARPWHKLLEELREAQIVHMPFTPTNPAFETPLYIREAVNALDSVEDQKRQQGIKVLASSKNPAAHEELARAVNHDLSDVRIEASIALSKVTLGSDIRAIPGLIDALRRKNPYVYSQARKELLKFSDEAIPWLVDTLEDEWSEARRRAVYLLGQLKAKSAIPQILHVIRHDSTLRPAAIQTLGQLGDPQVVPALVEILSEVGRGERKLVVEALGEFSHAEAIAGLIGSLRDRTSEVRDAAAQSLIKIGEPAVPEIVQALKDQNHEVRAAAAWILGAIGNTQVVQELLAALHDSNSSVRSHAAGALGDLRDPAALPELLQLLSDTAPFTSLSGQVYQDTNVASVAATALERIGTPEALAAVEQWRREQGGQV